VPTQADLDQLEQDLQRAIAQTRKQQKEGFWKRTFGRDKPAASEAGTPQSAPPATTPSDADAGSPPDPVPPSQPLPAPAGTPSGQP
jgi:hypothetical protein